MRFVFHSTRPFVLPGTLQALLAALIALQLILPMGSAGINALGQITGLEIEGGVYCYFDGLSKVGVIAVGVDREHGLAWEVWGLWTPETGFRYCLSSPMVAI
jgi:hypothetical protein